MATVKYVITCEKHIRQPLVGAAGTGNIKLLLFFFGGGGGGVNGLMRWYFESITDSHPERERKRNDGQDIKYN